MLDARRTLTVLVTLTSIGVCGSSLRAEDERPEATPGFWLAKAEQITRRMPHPEGRAALLVSIGTGWVEAGELARARPLLASAAKYGRQCRGCISKARRLAEVALLQHQAGDVEGARVTFASAREACGELDGGRQVQAQAYLALQLQTAGQEQVARALFAKATKGAGLLKGFERAEALAAIADAQAAAGDLEQAGGVRALLAKAVDAIGPDAAPILESVRLTAAAAEVAAGDRAAAAALLGEVAMPDLAVSGWVSLVRAAFEAGDREGAVQGLARAFEAVPEIEDPAERVHAWAEVARVAGDVGDGPVEVLALEGLERAGRKIESPISRFHAQVLWLDALRAARRDDRFRSEIDRLERSLAASPPEHAEDRARVRVLLAGLEARSGRFEQAEQVVAAVEDPARRASARLDLAEAYRKAGQMEPALAATAAVLSEVRTRTLPPTDGPSVDGNRDELMRQAAVLQAACGRPGDALKTVDAIAAPFHAATACTYIARDLT